MKHFHEITQRLTSVYPSGEASAMARWVMEERFGLSLTDLMMDKDSELSSDECQELENITERLLLKEPIQYILGQTNFCGLRIGVRPGVLIPRPETEELVDWICETYLQDVRSQMRVLDIGTGSGCIALTLAHHGFRTEAWDVSQEALLIAEENARRLNLKVQFSKENILQYSQGSEDTGLFDVIVSNPPYICQQETKEMEDNVLQHEPHLALFVPDDDPLLFYRHIADFALQHLAQRGNLFFEINRNYGDDVCQMLKEKGFTEISLRNDRFGNPRMVKASITTH